MTTHEHVPPLSPLGDFAWEQAMKLQDLVALVLDQHIEDVHSKDPDFRLINCLTDHVVALGRKELRFEPIPEGDPDYSPDCPIRLVVNKKG